jgi:hypothetical protein
VAFVPGEADAETLPTPASPRLRVVGSSEPRRSASLSSCARFDARLVVGPFGLAAEKVTRARKKQKKKKKN